MGKRVNLVRPDGSVVSADPSDVRLLEGLGYRVESVEESVGRGAVETERAHFQGWEQTGKAALEGGLSGLTLGASDLFLNGRETRGRAAQHPMARLGGEIVGALVPALATMGGSAEVSAGEIGGRAIERGLLRTALAEATPAGRLATGAARLGEAAGGGLKGALVAGGAEGAVYGAAGEVTRSQLSGDPLTAEHILAGAGTGLLFGTAGAGVAHGVGAAGRAALRSAEGGIEGAVSTEMTKLTHAMSASGVEDHYIPLPAQQARAAEEATVMARPVSGPAGDEIARSILPTDKYARFTQSVADMRTSAKRAVEMAEQAHRDAEKLVRQAKLTPIEQQAKDIVFRANEVAKEAVVKGENVAGITSAFKSLKAAQSKGEEAMKVALANYRTSAQALADKIGSPVSFLDDSASRLSDAVSNAKAVAETHAAVTALNVPKHPEEFLAMSRESAEKMVAAVGRFMESKVPEVAAHQQVLKGTIEELAAAAGVTTTGSPVDTLRATWSVGNQARAKKLWGVLDASEAAERSRNVNYGKRLWKESTAREAEAARGDRFDEAKTRVMPGAKAPKAEPEHHRGRGMIKKIARLVVGHKFAQVLGHGLAGRMVGYGAAGYAIGGEDGLLAGLVAAKANSVRSIERAVARWAPVASRAVRAGSTRYEYLNRSISGVQDPEADLRNRYKARTAEIRDAAYNGRDRAFLAAQALTAAGHGEAAVGLYKAATGAVDRLAASVPRKPLGTNWGFDDAYEPPPEVVRVFGEVHQALVTPLAFVDRAVDDPQSIHPAAAEAFKEGYPALWGEFRSRMIPVLSDNRAKLHGADLRAWSVILDFPLSPTMVPEFTAGQAAMYAAQPLVKPLPDEGDSNKQQTEPPTPGQLR